MGVGGVDLVDNCDRLDADGAVLVDEAVLIVVIGGDVPGDVRNRERNLYVQQVREAVVVVVDTARAWAAVGVAVAGRPKRSILPPKEGVFWG